MSVGGITIRCEIALDDRSRSTSARCWRLIRQNQIAASPEFGGLERDVAALDQLGVSFDHLECRLLALPPEADAKLVLVDVKITHREVWPPDRKDGVDIKLVMRRIRKESRQGLGEHEYRAGRPGSLVRII